MGNNMLNLLFLNDLYCWKVWKRKLGAALQSGDAEEIKRCEKILSMAIWLSVYSNSTP